MLKQALLLFAVLSLSFALTGEQCPQMREECKMRACSQAGGIFTEYNTCFKGTEFDRQMYDGQVASCESMYSFCTQNDGIVRNMSCCGPVSAFALMLVLICSNRPA